ncbi:MAG: hypothetical protein R3B68_05090 [Phycisphaerales bacterium]
MSSPGSNTEQRLDEVFDPSRLRRDAERAAAASEMPWQRKGVVMENPASRGLLWRQSPTKVPLGMAVVLAVCGAVLLIASFVAGATWRGAMGIAVLLLYGAGASGVQWWLLAIARKAGRLHPPRWGWLLVVFVLTVGIWLILLGWIPSSMAIMLVMLHMPLIGVMFMPTGLRQGNELRCAKCQFEYAYEAPGSPPAPDYCSECGQRWHDRHGLVRGRTARPTWGSGAFAVVLVALLLGLGVLRTPMLGLFPTGTLIRQVTAPNAGFVMDEWKELNTRTLSSDQRLRLARGLLDLRLAEQSLPAEADAWLDAEIVAGRLPPELVDRYHREMFDATLYGPQRVRVWENAVFGLDTLERGYPFAPRDAYLAIRGFSSDDDPATLRATQNALLYGSLAGGRSAWLGVQTARPGGVEAPFTFETPGTRRITCVYWLVVLPQNTPAGPITWNADGTPNLPAGTLFSERREIKVEVEVTP